MKKSEIDPARVDSTRSDQARIEKKYCLPSGTFRELCHTTRETLRYYEKAGILVPRQDPENGYKYYSHAQIASFYYIRSLTELGSSIAEIKEAAVGGNADRFSDFVDETYMTLLEKREELDRKLSLIRTTSTLMNRAAWMKTGVPRISALSMTTRIRASVIVSPHPYSAADITADISRHVDVCRAAGVEAFPMGTSIAREDFEAGRYPYRELFTITLEEADTAHVGGAGRDVELPARAGDAGTTGNVAVARAGSVNQLVVDGEAATGHGRSEDDQTPSHAEGGVLREVVIPRGTRIASVTASDEKGDIRRIYRRLLSAVRKEGCTLASDVFSISLINTVRGSEERAYYKLIFATVEG